MIIILNYKKNSQNKIKKFIIENIKKELFILDYNVFKEVTKDLDDIYTNYIKCGGEMLYAYDIQNRKIVGTIAMTFENNIALLKRFYVDEKYRNRKIGFLLYQMLEKKIKQKHIDNIYLTTGVELKKAHKFYKKNGWIIEKQNPGIKIRDGAFLYKKNIYKEVEYCYL